MLNADNKVNYEINAKKEEKKYSWSTVFTWLYLKTIGRILPKRWNRWAENILYYDKTTVSNEIQTDDLKALDKSVPIDLKPEVAEKDGQIEVVSEDKEVQTDKVVFQDMAMQIEYIGTTDQSFQANLESEREKELENQLHKSMQEKQILESQINQLKDQVSQLTQEKESSKSLMVGRNELQEEVKNLQFKLIGMEGEKQELKKQLGDTGHHKEQIQQDLNLERDRIVQLEKELQLSKDRANEIDEGNWSDALSESSEDLLELASKQLLRSQAQQQELQEQLKEKTETLRRVVNENNQLKNRLEGLHLKLNEDIRQLSSTRAEVQESLDLERNKVTTLEEELKQEKERNVRSLAEISDLKKQSQSIQDSEQQKACELQKEKIQLESRLEDLGSQLNATEEEKSKSETALSNQEKKWKADLSEKTQEIENLKELKKGLEKDLQGKNQELAEQERLNEQLRKEQTQKEGQLEVNIRGLQEEREEWKRENEELQKQVRHLDAELKKARSIVVESIEVHGKALDENLELKQRIESLTDDDEETQSLDVASIVSTVSTTQSTVSKLWRLSNKLFKDNNLERFCSQKNEKLKDTLPEFKKKHFCHNVLNETIEFLSNRYGGKFKSDDLLELLKDNLEKSARKIVEDKVREVVGKHYNIGKNISKELRDGTLKSKLLTSVKQCMQKLIWYQRDADTITNSILDSFKSNNKNSYDPEKLLREIVVEELMKERMGCFLSKMLELASSIRDKFLSPDQKICSQIPEGENMYQLSTEIMRGNTPNSSMHNTSSTMLSSERAVHVR